MVASTTSMKSHTTWADTSPKLSHVQIWWLSVLCLLYSMKRNVYSSWSHSRLNCCHTTPHFNWAITMSLYCSSDILCLLVHLSSLHASLFMNASFSQLMRNWWSSLPNTCLSLPRVTPRFLLSLMRRETSVLQSTPTYQALWDWGAGTIRCAQPNIGWCHFCRNSILHGWSAFSFAQYFRGGVSSSSKGI